MNTKTALMSSRSVVKVDGVDSEKFLADLFTNTLPNDGNCTFAGLLTPQGKILFDFFIMRDGVFLIDISSKFVEEFIKRLTFYKLRADVSISDISSEKCVLTMWDGKSPDTFTDPRHKELGYRHISDIGTTPTSCTEAEYTAHRISLGVPEGGIDYLYGETFPHDACYDLLNGVDFQKGCYVGQEVVSRMKHRGTARKRIVMVQADTPLPPTGTDILANSQKIGRLGSVDGSTGLALVRLDRAGKAVESSLPILADDVAISLKTPDWANYKIES